MWSYIVGSGLWLPIWVLHAGPSQGLRTWIICHGGPFVAARDASPWLLVGLPLTLVLLVVLAWRRPSPAWALVLTPLVLAWFALACLAISARLK